MTDIECPHVGESGGCDDCVLGLEPMTCYEELMGFGQYLLAYLNRPSQPMTCYEELMDFEEG